MTGASSVTQLPPQGTPDTPAPRRQVRLGRLWIDALSFEEALRAIEALVLAGAGGSVFTPNVDHVVTAENDPAFRAAYQDASLALADGQPLIWAARALGTPLPAKVSGSDLVRPLMKLAGERSWRVYLVGGGPGVAAAVATRLEREFGVSVAGVDASTIHSDADGQGDAVAERVRAAAPDLVLVALGAPKQERWIHRNLQRIRPAVAVAVGGSLDFLAGRIRRAPPWMSRAGLEWAFRLAQEPRRLARRYLVKDTRFLLVFARALMSPRSHRIRELPGRGIPPPSRRNAPDGEVQRHA